MYISGFGTTFITKTLYNGKRTQSSYSKPAKNHVISKIVFKQKPILNGPYLQKFWFNRLPLLLTTAYPKVVSQPVFMKLMHLWSSSKMFWTSLYCTVSRTHLVPVRSTSSSQVGKQKGGRDQQVAIKFLEACLV